LGVVGSAGKEVRDHETSGNTAVAYQKQSEIKIMSCLRWFRTFVSSWQLLKLFWKSLFNHAHGCNN
jgi:hypothetical protein